MQSEILSLAVGKNFLFCAGYDANIYVHDAREEYALKKTLTGHKWEIWQLVFVDGALFSGSFDHSIRRWSILDDSMECTATLSGHKGSPRKKEKKTRRKRGKEEKTLISILYLQVMSMP